jgi:hypothetical protein
MVAFSGEAGGVSKDVREEEKEEAVEDEDDTACLQYRKRGGRDEGAINIYAFKSSSERILKTSRNQ